jgi:hypothetical protein
MVVVGQFHFIDYSGKRMMNGYKYTFLILSFPKRIPDGRFTTLIPAKWSESWVPGACDRWDLIQQTTSTYLSLSVTPTTVYPRGVYGVEHYRRKYIDESRDRACN